MNPMQSEEVMERWNAKTKLRNTADLSEFHPYGLPSLRNAITP